MNQVEDVREQICVYVCRSASYSPDASVHVSVLSGEHHPSTLRTVRRGVTHEEKDNRMHETKEKAYEYSRDIVRFVFSWRGV